MALNPEQEQALKIADVVSDTILAHLKVNLYKVSELEMRSFCIAYSAIKMLSALAPELVAAAFARAAWTFGETQRARKEIETLAAAVAALCAVGGIPEYAYKEGE